LAYHGFIPEYVPSVTSVSTGGPERVSTRLGNYIFRHIKKTWFYDYRNIDLGQGQSAFIADPEKALLDLVYLTSGSDNMDYLTELRLQNVDTGPPGGFETEMKYMLNPIPFAVRTYSLRPAVYDSQPRLMEILSPSTAYYDLKPKSHVYEQYGVKEYWIVDPIEMSIEIFENKEGSFHLLEKAVFKERHGY